MKEMREPNETRREKTRGYKNHATTKLNMLVKADNKYISCLNILDIAFVMLIF